MRELWYHKDYMILSYLLVPGGKDEEEVSPGLTVQRDVAMILQPYFAADGLVTKCLDYAADLDHVMDFTRLRALGSLFSMLNQNVRNVIIYNNNHPDFPMQVIHVVTQTHIY